MTKLKTYKNLCHMVCVAYNTHVTADSDKFCCYASFMCHDKILHQQSAAHLCSLHNDESSDQSINNQCLSCMLWTLTCTHKSSRVRVPPSIFTHCPHPPCWSKPRVTPEEYLSCALICLKGTISWGSRITTVGCREEGVYASVYSN